MARVYTLSDQGDSGLLAAAAALRRGGVVIFPTETFYGIAVAPQNTAAVARLVRLKSRLPHKPIPLIAKDTAACAEVAHLPDAVAPLCAAFWPGPLTLVLTPHDPAAWAPAIVGSAAPLALGMRVSSHPMARALAEACGGLVTATSANFAQVAPVTTCAALDADLVAQVDVVLDGGVLTGGLPSTVVRVDAAGGFEVLREGAVSAAQIAHKVQS